MGGGSGLDFTLSSATLDSLSAEILDWIERMRSTDPLSGSLVLVSLYRLRALVLRDIPG